MGHVPLKLPRLITEITMSILLSPFYSDFESEEEAESYDRWFRAKVQAALDDPRPGIPHVDAMVRLDQLLEEKRKNRRAAA
jgi:hypothetical protein